MADLSNQSPDRVGLRECGRRLGVTHAYVHRLITRGVIARGDDGLIDVAAARAAMEASRSPAHRHMDDINAAQRAKGRRSSPGPGASSPEGKPEVADERAPETAPVRPPLERPEPGADPLGKAAAANAEALATRRRFDHARTTREDMQARLAELEWQEKSGALVPRVLAERVLFECGRASRDAWMSFAGRVAPVLATQVGLADSDALQAALAQAVLEQVTALGDPTADFSPDAHADG